MDISVMAVYEGGILKLEQPLPFKEHERVRLTVHGAGNPVDDSAGLLPCSDPELIERIALDSLESL
jgi:predicted DNA-binding antitoxin AbrB/MazE fold protein